MSKRLKVLVTGGAGFIGSHLVDRLLEDGHEATVLDNFATGRSENLAKHYGSPNLNLQQIDITDREDIQPHFRDVDWVFHLAALADIVPSIKQPMDYHQVNVAGTVNVLEAARLAGVNRFIPLPHLATGFLILFQRQRQPISGLNTPMP